MKTYIAFLSLALAFAAVGEAQTTKSKTQTQKQTPERIVKGTVQMAGDNGKLGVTYTLGKLEPINVTVTDVRFSVVREVVGNSVVAPGKDEKLLVIDFIAHNPNPKTIPFDGGAIKFTGVDQESVNRVGTGTFTRAKTGEPFNTELKPAQKVELRTIVIVPAAGTVPKLMLEHRSGGPVLRYDLKPALKPLVAPFVDAKDDTGMSALGSYDCTPDTYYPMANIDIKLAADPISLHGQKFGPNTLGKDKVFCAVKFTLKGQSPTPAGLRFAGLLFDENGEKYPVVKIAQMSTEDHVVRQLEMDQEYTVRFIVVMPANVKPKSIQVMDQTAGSNSRIYNFKLAS